MSPNSSQSATMSESNTTSSTMKENNGDIHRPDLHRLRTAETVVMSPELFEKLYLAPQSAVKGELRSTLGNPTPLALSGLLVTLTPLACQFMGWRGGGGDGAATVGTFVFMGGLLTLLGAIGEFLLGNSFPLMVFGTYAGFSLSYGATLQPGYNAYGAFAPTPGDASEGFESVAFLVGIGYWAVFMALFSFFSLICSLRTNAVFVFVLVCLTMVFSFVGASEFYGAEKNWELFHTYRVAAGAMIFSACIAGWYLLFALALTTTDMPFSLPVGDLSTVIKSGTQKAKLRQRTSEHEA